MKYCRIDLYNRRGQEISRILLKETGNLLDSLENPDVEVEQCQEREEEGGDQPCPVTVVPANISEFIMFS